MQTALTRLVEAAGAGRRSSQSINCRFWESTNSRHVLLVVSTRPTLTTSAPRACTGLFEAQVARTPDAAAVSFEAPR